MAPPTIRVREPRELLALLPYELGFRPQESAVAVSLRAPRRRVGLVARVDLADLGDLDAGPQLARGLVSHLVADGARDAVLVLYTAEDPRHRFGRGRPSVVVGTGPGETAPGPTVPGPTLAGVARAAHARVGAGLFCVAAEPFLGEVAVWVVTASGYLALDCDDDGCCPPGGRPLRDLESTQVGAHMVLAGASVQDSRDDLAQIRPAPAARRRNAVRVADRARSRRARAAAAGPEQLHQWRADGLASWRAALDAGRDCAVDPYRDSYRDFARDPDGGRDGSRDGSRDRDGATSAAIVGRIEAALSDVQVRDAILLTLVPGAGDLAERSLREDDAEDGSGGRGGRTARVSRATTEALGRIADPATGVPPDEELLRAAASVLERVVAHAHGPRRAPALALLALLAWWQTDSARAGVLVERALTDDPGHRLAHLVLDALSVGLPPGWVRRTP
ncbi:DUF4192 domain-containing protein [Pengzhenrongella sicca]|uniref:DUF4192 domain-containing protein n=1 Tax=Pengzhenrongella sicca TaxID=2819238 RepID=A0A8A4ZBU8_9MICO|nr:DUF4192 domain-containing protein [Pengzhenrongella sicca]QTE28353.1 DUF4192 domain-containing protein [Pengzhenrongella sicca]